MSVPAPSMHSKCVLTTQVFMLQDLQHKTAQNVGFPKYSMRGPAACRHLQLQSSFTDAISSVLLMGGDTDTNAAIVGGMIGALQGASSIPDSMKMPVLARGIDAEGIPRPAFLTTEALPTICKQLHQLAGDSLP